MGRIGLDMEDTIFDGGITHSARKDEVSFWDLWGLYLLSLEMQNCQASFLI